MGWRRKYTFHCNPLCQMNFLDFMYVLVEENPTLIGSSFVMLLLYVRLCTGSQRVTHQGIHSRVEWNVNATQSIISCCETASRREGTDGEPPVCQEWRPLLGTGRKLRSMFWWSERWCCESAALSMPANLENSAVATGLEKISFHSNPKERQCQRMLKLLHNCTHLTH